VPTTLKMTIEDPNAWVYSTYIDVGQENGDSCSATVGHYSIIAWADMLLDRHCFCKDEWLQ